MWNFLLHYLVYPIFGFMFEFIGDRPWLLAILVALIALVIWRFLWPFVTAFNTIFGWKGWALIGVALLTFGAFGAGWRAHRDSVYPLSKTDDATDKPPPKKHKKVTTDTSAYADTEGAWYKITHGLPLN